MEHTDVSRRAAQFLERAERLTAIGDDRPVAFEAIFGHKGLYVSAFPTHEERMMFRDVPLARAKLFALLGRMPAPEDGGQREPTAR